MLMNTFVRIAGVLFLLSALTGNIYATQSGRHFTLLPQWVPQAQFAGYYVALEKGFYAKSGIAVSILRGGPDRPSAEWLKKGVADFATMFLSTAIVEHSKGTGLVNVSQIASRSSQVLIARKSSGIKSLQDIKGKKVGLWGAELSIIPMALFRKYGLEVKVIPQSSTVNLFLRGGVDVVSAMWYNEYHTILSSGIEPEELTIIRLSDLGFNVPEDGIYCLESTFQKDPQSCCLFVKATLEGWKYALENREEAVDIVMKYVKEAIIPTNREHQKWMLDRLSEVIQLQASAGDPTKLNEADYMAVAGELVSSGLVQKALAFSDFIADCAGINEK